MKRLSQENAPIYEALKWYKNQRIVPFDVPVINKEEEIQN